MEAKDGLSSENAFDIQICLSLGLLVCSMNFSVILINLDLFLLKLNCESLK